MTSDAELIRRVLSGDPLAERALYDRHVDAVYRTAYRLSGDGDVAADYTQETFIRAFRGLAQFRADAPFPAWLRAVTASVALTGEKKRRRYRGTVELDTVVDQRTTRPPGAFDIVDRVAAALNGMPEKLRTVFLLHDVEGYTHEEIGSALDIPSGTSRARLAEAKAKLRSALSDYGREEAS